MAKKRKSKESTADAEEEVPPPQPKGNDAGSDSDDDSSSDDDSLVLEGTLIRNPDASDSDDDEDDISSEEEEDNVPTKKKAKGSSGASTKKSSQNDTKNNNNTAKNQKSKQQQAKKKKNKSKEPEPETIEVEFLFCDMQEQFFHGMKTLIHRHSIHAPHSSQLSDLIIENEMVGTVLSSDIDPSKNGHSNKKKSAKSTKGTPAVPLQEEANVFGFASIVNVTTNHASPCIQSLKATCLKHCPAQHKAEMETVLSGKTKRPAGFFFQERMVNVPLEITEVLHHQLILDMDHAVKTADDEAERKSLDFGAFVRIAPCYKSESGAGDVIYKYFDDEVFATNAEFVYSFAAPKHYEGEEEELWCSVIVMTKTGHRGAMKELKKMIHGGL